jgi:glycerol-3-phosphate acyltransferase PlsY
MRALISDGGPEGVEMTPGFLLGAAVLMTIPMVSVLLSRIPSHGLARCSSVVAGIVLTLVQVATLFVGTATMYYVYFSVIEIATAATIVVVAWRWRTEG